MTQSRPLSQSELKRLVARAALDYVESGAVLGVGTGSTVDQLIDQLSGIRDRIPACVSSSERSTKRLEALGFKVLDMNEVDSIGVYIDGADEIDGHFAMIRDCSRLRPLPHHLKNHQNSHSVARGGAHTTAHAMHRCAGAG